MKHRCTKTSVLIAAGLLASLTQAAATNITIPDFNGPGGVLNTGTPWGFGGGPLGQAGEDNEVEYSAWRNQYWDLEAFVLKGSTLYLVGGYEFEKGYAGGPGRPGDLFIKVGGPQPGPSPLSNPTGGNISNSTYGFSYAVNLSSGNLSGGSVGVKGLTSDTLRTVHYDSLGSNPWKVLETTAVWTSQTAVTYYPGLKAESEDEEELTVASLTGVTGLKGDTDGPNPGANVYYNSSTPPGPHNLHNVVAIDISFLQGAGNLWFSYTMQCGNDSIKGHIPDGGTTLVLLGTALSGLFLVGRRFSKQ